MESETFGGGGGLGGGYVNRETGNELDVLPHMRGGMQKVSLVQYQHLEQDNGARKIYTTDHRGPRCPFYTISFSCEYGNLLV